jgi:hypothetical protein
MQYTGIGSWTQSAGHYTWQESGCSSIVNQAFKDCSWKNTRVAFVGDSVLRNLYYETAIWMDENHKFEYAFPYAIKNMQYFEEYGYYPLQSFKSSTDPRCCGETDCVQRQAARNGKLGLTALNSALGWLKGDPTEGNVLVVHSPIVHTARAYVSDEQFRKQIIAILAALRPRLAEAEHDRSLLTIWMSATSPREDITPEPSFMENGASRRYRLYMIEKEVLAGAPRALHHMDVWNMTRRRRDRYFDYTHVFPYPAYATKAGDHNRTISKAWVSMLDTIISSSTS